MSKLVPSLSFKKAPPRFNSMLPRFMFEDVIDLQTIGKWFI